MRYHWAGRGDVNAFFGLMLDNVAVMVLLVTLISGDGDGKFTHAFVLTHMIPGTAVGVLLGDLLYSWMAFRLARRTGRPDVTAMPLGLDTPSTFGVALLVLIPALQKGHQLFGDHERAMAFAWQVGLTVLVLAGVFKVICAPLGNAVRRLVPRAGLLGSLAAIALTLIAFLPLLLDGIAAVPLVGVLALGVILLTLVARRPLPWKIPGALAAVLLGVAVYQLLSRLGPILGIAFVPPPEAATEAPWDPTALVSFYGESAAWWGPVFAAALAKLPVVLPFALATIVGGIDCTESAAAAGDDYDTRAILLTEAVASLLAGLLGGVIQTTPYIGHPAYKKMGGRTAYTLATALFIGAVGYFGGFALLFHWLPRAALYPILVFIGLEITAQSFQATPTRHYPALALAALPALAYLASVPLNMALGGRDPDPSSLTMVQTLRCLANGFLISGMLWAAALAMLLDGRLRASAGFLGVAAVCAFFGVIHSPLRFEQIGLPDAVLELVARTPFKDAVQCQTPYHWAAAYGVGALLLLGLAPVQKDSPQGHEEETDRTSDDAPSGAVPLNAGEKMRTQA